MSVEDHDGFLFAGLVEEHRDRQAEEQGPPGCGAAGGRAARPVDAGLELLFNGVRECTKAFTDVLGRARWRSIDEAAAEFGSLRMLLQAAADEGTTVARGLDDRRVDHPRVARIHELGNTLTRRRRARGHDAGHTMPDIFYRLPVEERLERAAERPSPILRKGP